MPPLSAGILLYRVSASGVEVLIGHPGGPFWANRHAGAWSIPKGLVDHDEDPLDAARREFCEETGMDPGETDAVDLGTTVLRSGKKVRAWAMLGDLDPASTQSNLVRMEWPRNSGRSIEFPEIDELRWCSVAEAAELLNPAQRVSLERSSNTLTTQSSNRYTNSGR